MNRLAAILAATLACTAARAQAPEPIKLGLILDMSGVYQDVNGPGSVVSTKMAVEDFGGSVLGRPIEVVVADHQNKADIAAAIATKWFDQDHVTALMDVAASSTALAAMNVAHKYNKIIILNAPGALSITNEACIPTAVHYTYDTYGQAHTTGLAVVARGGKAWFFVGADYTFGHQLEEATAEVVKANGGKVLGTSFAPLGTTDFSANLLAAQSSGADVVGFANGGTDVVNSVKQAAEFGLDAKQRLIALLAYIQDIESMGLKYAQGMMLSASFYWDLNDETRAWSKRYFDRFHAMPNMSQAGVYSSTLHYLRAVQKAGTTEPGPVMQAMRETPIHDFYAQNGHIREDGRMVHDMFLFEVKTPAESKSPFDLYKLVATVPGEQAFQPLSESRCPLVKH